MSTPPANPPLDLTNIQGDILLVDFFLDAEDEEILIFIHRSGLPKKTQFYIFFDIKDAAKFRADLVKFIPVVKTVAQVLKDRDDIADHKRRGLPGLIPMVGVNIAFSHTGFQKLGIDDSTLTPLGDNDPFKIGQKRDAVTNLGDKTRSDGQPDWDEKFLQDLHGIILISGESHVSIEKKKLDVEAIFHVHTPKASIQEITTIRGDVRPGDQSAHEQYVECIYRP
ncbi:hypothetical protein NLJ89_g10713 [Agrocybe chaxingu]|uniref:DyP dimeric alpha+beta barrel domain-containing protein n=1 Tax=Agrocybe chaxingu TaxID=84603 RepID=A0A9W8JR89_9AGAR|nr:hypothetical protein NLJ89_g10713 [Agrocybe chaxingu]